MDHQENINQKTSDNTVDTTSKRKGKFKIFVFFICLVISFLLWLMISLSQTQTEHLSIPVKVSNLPDEYVLVEQSERNIAFQVQASGQAIETLNKNRKKLPVEFDLTHVELQEEYGRYKISLPTQPYLKTFTQQLGFNGTIDNVLPDTITLYLERSSKKEVPVSFNAHYRVADLYKQYHDPVISPEKIIIKGKKELLDTIQFIRTRSVDLGEISDTMTRTLALERLPSLYLSTEDVQVTFYVAKFTEKQLVVSLKAVAKDSSMLIKLLPDHVTITCLVPVDQFSNIVPDMFVVEATYSEDAGKYVDRLPVQAVKVPDNVEITRIDPDNVSYIIMEK